MDASKKKHGERRGFGVWPTSTAPADIVKAPQLTPKINHTTQNGFAQHCYTALLLLRYYFSSAVVLLLPIMQLCCWCHCAVLLGVESYLTQQIKGKCTCDYCSTLLCCCWCYCPALQLEGTGQGWIFLLAHETDCRYDRAFLRFATMFTTTDCRRLRRAKPCCVNGIVFELFLFMWSLSC